MKGKSVMQKKVRRRHEADVRAQNVCAEHSQLFDATPGGQKMRVALGAHVADVDRLLALQERSLEDRRAATEQCRLSRRALRDAAKAVVSVGRVVKLDAVVMGTMRLPSGANDDEPLVPIPQRGFELRRVVPPSGSVEQHQEIRRQTKALPGPCRFFSPGVR
jgi:hypothetical protein